MIFANSLDDVVQALTQDHDLKIAGARTKTALSSDAGLSLSKMSGVLQYDPDEYTFTALAGTPLWQVESALAEHGQFMPFDPPMVRAGKGHSNGQTVQTADAGNHASESENGSTTNGATLGGTIAAGLSGSGRFRFGGVRDFLLGVKMVTRAGRVVFGGSKVVKNAAGFDIPKLVVGSLGRFGALVEVTFKVFPKPECYSTMFFDHENIETAINSVKQLARLPLDLTCLDLEPTGRVWIRFGGIKSAQSPRQQRILNLLADATSKHGKFESDDEEVLWRGVGDFDYLRDHRLLKVPITTDQIGTCESLIQQVDPALPRRYAVGGNVLWLGWPIGGSSAKLDGMCIKLGRQALALTGNWQSPFLGETGVTPFAERLEKTFGVLG